MTDPVTIGTLVASALAMAADATIKGFVGKAAEDSYKALKEKVAHWASSDVEALEKTPTSTSRQGVVAEAVDGQPADEQAAVKELATKLLAALKKDAGGAVGLDVGTLEALEVQLGAFTVTEGTGARMKKVKTGVFKTGPFKVGPPPGKR